MKKLLAFILIFCSCFGVGFIDDALQVNAASYKESFPTYSLYTNESIITKEYISYDISTVIDYQIEESLSYEVVAEKESVHDFYVPFSSTVYNVPDIEVKVNGKAINTELLYGADSIWFKNDTTMAKAVSEAYSAEIDETMLGTLYTVTAASDSMTISYKINGTYPMIYDCGNSYTANLYDGITTYTTNTIQGETYNLFVIGTDFEVFETADTFTKSEITCKEYVDDYYMKWQEYYDECNIDIGYLYSETSRLIDTKNKISSHEFFLDSSSNYKMNFFKFSVVIQDNPTIITYSQKARVQRDTTYEPYIFMFERCKSNQYITEYEVEMTEEFPFIIESNLELSKEGNKYKAASDANSFYVIYCNEETSKSKFAEETDNNKLVWYIVLAGVFVLVVGVATCFVVDLIERKKRCK